MIEANSMFRTLADFDNRKIIFSIIKKPRTVSEIVQYTKLPQSTVFKKITELEKMELIKPFDPIIWFKKYSNLSDIGPGPKPKVYISVILSARITITSEKADVKLIENILEDHNG